MTTSPEATKTIAGFEADKLNPYNDLSDNATEGIGHLMHLGPLTPSEEHPETMAKSLSDFANDLKNRAEKYVESFVRVPLTQNRYDALVSFTYNLGPGILEHLVSETGLNNRNYSAVPAKILQYNKSRINGVLVEVAGLTRRRQWETRLWSADENPQNS
jgi:lysozyme